MWAASELERARTRNDAVELTAEQTAANRGEIRFIKKLLALPEAAARDQQSGSAQAHSSVWGDTTPEG